MKHLILALLISCAQLVPVKFQEVTEFSGDSLVSVSPAQTPDSLESSGEGPAVITVLDDAELIADLLNNDTDLSSLNFKDGDLSNETTLSTTSATTSTMTTTVTSTTTEATTLPSTTTTPETTTTVATTTTTPTTTTVSTTTTPPPTTTPTTTRLTTTRRPTTKSTTTKRMTTKMPLFTTTISPEKIIPKSDVPCEFTEKDLVCDTELSCFGEGTIDCTMTDDESPAVVDSKPSSAATTDIPDDYEEESATVGFFPPDLVGRIPPRFAFPWNIKPLDEMSPEPSTESTLDSSSSTESPATLMMHSTTERKENSSSTITPESSTNLVTNIMAAASTILPTAFIGSTPSRDNVTEILGESSTFTINNVTVEEPSTVKPSEDSTSSGLVTRLEAMTGPTETSLESSDGVTKQEMTAVLRRKRDSNKKESSQSLKLAAEDTKRQTGSCKVTGNLHCTPNPTRAFCKGIGTCKVISMEKTEKSTSSKGVENWAIAVIAICATAAALTIGLLVYLVVTSWKKLKVQPQNGVTTLNYVNNSPP